MVELKKKSILFFLCITIFVCCACKNDRDMRDDPITKHWVWSSSIMEDGSVVENNSRFDMYPKFASNGKTYTLATREDRVYEGTIEKDGEGHYTITYANGNKTGTILIEGNYLSIEMGQILIKYELSEE